MTAYECGSDVQSSRLSPSSVCARRKRRSQSIPAELAAPSTSPYTERPTECAPSLEAGAAHKVSEYNHAWGGSEALLSGRIEVIPTERADIPKVNWL